MIFTDGELKLRYKKFQKSKGFVTDALTQETIRALGI